MTTTKSNIPALRFKDEQGNSYPNWEERKLGQIFTVRYGKEHKYLSDGNVPVIGTGGVIRHANGVLYSEPSVLIGRKGTIDKPQFVNRPFWAVDTVFFTEIEPSNVSYFVFLIVSKIHWKRYNEASGLPSLSANTIKEIRVNVPLKKEQQKIASFLSSVDTKIEQLGKKKALLEQYKKGMMQKLFSQEIRFKDEQGNEYPGWDKRKLSDFSEINRGKTIVRNDIVNEGYPVIAGGQRSPYCHSSFTHENVITVSASGAFAGYVSYHPHKIWASDCSVVRAKSSSCTLFVYYLLNHLQTRIYVLQSGGAQPHVYPKDLYTLTVTIPVSSKEQQKIANFLSAIDKKIELVAQQLEQARTFKKGLLQQMFI